jgi:hypothetical protein
MGNSFRWVRPICILLLASILSWGTSFAQNPTPQASDSVYFPETGHYVTGDFLTAYQSAIEPDRIYGWPITEAFTDSTGRLVQYFQKTVLESHPNDPPELRIRPQDLGYFLRKAGSPLPLPPNFPACRVFPEDPNKYQVCYSFLDFYLTYGGPSQFGYPISNFEIQDGRIVQSFQRARFEWHPEQSAGNKVVLTDLGRLQFDSIGENPKRLQPVSEGSNIPHTVLGLRVRAFPKYAFTSRDDTQTIYILVQDQKQAPVENAQVTLILTLPSGKIERYIVPGLTDENGMISYTFDYRKEIVGSARVLINAAYESLQQQTTTSFRIWW